MREPDIPADEESRLLALRSLALLDTAPEERFDRITRIAKTHFNVPVALVSLIDSQRQWFKSKQGIDVCESPRSLSICGHTILQDDILCIPDTLLDPRFEDNPMVTGFPNVRFYAGAPLHAPGGERIGTLCILDNQAREMEQDILSSLRDLADIVEDEFRKNALLESHTERLLWNTQKFHNLIFHVPGAVFLCKIKPGFPMTFVDKKSEALTGFAAHDFVEQGNLWWDRVHKDDREILKEALQSAVKNGSAEFQLRFHHRGGYYIQLKTQLNALYTDIGEPVELLGISFVNEN